MGFAGLSPSYACYVAGISRQLRPQHIHHAPRDTRHLKGGYSRAVHFPQ